MEKMTIEQRFWRKIDQSSGQGPKGDCWIWLGAIDNTGYGACRYLGKKRNSHRIAFELTHGPIERHLELRHTCDVRLCCNPEHLISGTRLQNVQDAMERNRNVKGESNGNSKFSEKQAKAVKQILASGCKCSWIAALVGCNPETIRMIKRGETWKHVS